MNPTTKIHLNSFVPRPYQLPVCRAFEEKKYRKFLIINPRRSGKDYVWWSLMIREAIQRPGLYLYCLPTFAQGRSVIWDGKTNTGASFLDAIPPELIKKMRQDMMSITLINDAMIKVIGSDSYNNSIVGSNPRMIVFSEYAISDENAYKLAAMPILKANDGMVAIISTPRGKNHLYELFQIANNSSDWFVQFLTIEDTGHISVHEVQREIQSGEISEDLAQQEYYCSFDRGQEGSYYAKYLDKMRLRGQIGSVPWEPYHKVITSWDLGIKDPTCIIAAQLIGETIRVIDYYEASDKPMNHFAQWIKNKEDEGWVFYRHFPPHDVMVRELSRGLTRREMYKELGINFTDPVEIGIEDGIELVRRSFSKMWIDETNCKKLLKALENYREEFDVKRKVYKGRPLHDWSSHACFIGSTLILTRNGMRQIMDVQENDEVFTLHGWKKCTKAFKTIQNAQLVEVIFKDGTKVKCTPDHLFMANRKWKYAKDLLRGTKIQSSLTYLRSTLREDYISYGLVNAIMLSLEEDCTETFGKELLEKSQKATTSITGIVTHITTACGIWNVSHRATILHYLDRITKDFLKKHVTMLRNGIGLMKEGCGIEDTLYKLLHGLSGKERTEIVCTARRYINALFAIMGMSKSFATQIVRPPIIEEVRYIDECEDVWDITVPEMGHFSLSNGAIVHNSDCMRYLCAAIPKARDNGGAEALEKRYREAVYGNQSNMPKFFRE